MLIVSFDRRRFSETFRPRMAEWGLALCLLLWGVFVATSPGLFLDRPYFAPLVRVFAQTTWAVGAIGIGLGRLAMLARNGGWRPSANWRAGFCALSCMFWMALCVGALSVEWRSPAAAVYSVLYVMDMISAWFAAGDYRNPGYAHGR